VLFTFSTAVLGHTEPSSIQREMTLVMSSGRHERIMTMRLRSLLLAAAVMPLAFGPAAAINGPQGVSADTAVIFIKTINLATLQDRVDDAQADVRMARKALRRAEKTNRGIETAEEELTAAEWELQDARSDLRTAERALAEMDDDEDDEVVTGQTVSGKKPKTN
jgi:hypothetical protein